MNENTVLMHWICSDLWQICDYYTQITIPRQELNAMKIVIPSFIQQRITSFTGLYNKSWNKHLIKLITFKKHLSTQHMFCLLMHVHYILSLKVH